MRLRFRQPITLQQDLYAALSDFLGEYERVIAREKELKGGDRANLLIRWSQIMKNVIFLHLDREG